MLHTLMPRERLSCGLAALSTLLVIGAMACERERSTSSEAVSPTSSETPPPGSSPEKGEAEHEHGGEEHDHDEEGEHGHGDEGEHGHDHGGIRLGLKMQHISHRFAAIWYAGRSEHLAMLDYQLHELRETAETIIDADIEEHGVDVGHRLESNVLSGLEGLEKAAEKGNVETFESRYQAVRRNCNTCHADTKHGFINVSQPTRNPYPNVDLSSSQK